jgi:hypothetical protein
MKNMSRVSGSCLFLLLLDIFIVFIKKNTGIILYLMKKR